MGGRATPAVGQSCLIATVATTAENAATLQKANAISIIARRYIEPLRLDVRSNPEFRRNG
jgi:hypothetical protein